MKAIVVKSDKERSLAWREVADPVFQQTECLVEVHATAVNRADLLQRAGQYPPPPDAPPYLGLEMAGIVAETGDAVDHWKPGDRVCALLAGGGYAERVAVPQTHLMGIPDEWDFARAAALPEVFLTAFVNLFMEAQLAPGETTLVHGGASGVGTAAIQLCREVGCAVLTTAGTARKLEVCRELGAALAVNYKEEEFSRAVSDHCGGVDVILDIAGASHMAGNLDLLNSCGRLVVIAVLGGAEAQVDLSRMLRQRIRLIGSVLRSRSIDEKTTITRQFQRRFWPALVAGRIRPIIDRVLPVARAAEAHDILAANANIGKVVLSIREH